MRISDWSSDVCSSDLAASPGTRVTVENLFAQVPARRKFLRSERAELGACVDVVRRLAMSRPDTGFTLVHEGRRQIAVQPGDRKSVVQGKCVSVRVDFGGRRLIQKTNLPRTLHD